MYHSDILCAQETHFCNKKCSHRKFPHVFTANVDSKTKGVLIAIRDSVAFTLRKQVQDPLGRFLILICDLDNTSYMIVNVYSPNKNQVNFFNKLMKRVNNHQRGRLVICGNFNVTPDPAIHSTTKTTRYHPALMTSIHKHSMYDAWRCLHAGERDFTFFSPPHWVYTRIDLFLIDHQVLLQTKKVTINNITWSDHAYVVLYITNSVSSQPSPIWRFNTFFAAAE